ncbi:hypothetical protein [Providencia phage PSTCR7]|uniref:Uncharacterized protein n=1 Tax=Providencia phage PSTCR7 TaxID=2783549 RepID=A0A7S9XHA3_9CAUD|nr:hypothetical protein PQD10_gp48 [Providencia phage PSTCR7]QPI18500.1 hypothetical protein [Providencia phage PSTCR7]
MKTITYNKKAIVTLPEAEGETVAFQLVEYVINFFGTEVRNTLDTRITKDGRQFFIDGDGFIDAGSELITQ